MVTGDLLDDLRAVALSEHERERSVAQIVKPRCQTRGLSELLPGPLEPRWPPRLTVLFREHQRAILKLVALAGEFPTCPAILVFNHRSYFDPIVMGLVIAKTGRNVRGLGKKEVFDAPIVGPIAEELLFRGFVQRIFARNMSGALAVALAGVLFGLSHFSIAVLPGVVALGVLYGYIYHATRSLWCPIMAHAVFNFSSLLRLHAATEEEIISAAVELPGIALTLLSLAACVVSLGLLRRAARAGGFHRRRA